MNKLAISLFMLFILAACGNISSGLVQGQWILISYGSPSDQVLAVPDVDASIEFDSEGRMNGNVGCNGFGGDYTVDGGTIRFGPIMSTMMFCEGPVGAQEMETIAVFQESAQFVIDGDTMMITSADGESSITLGRK
jgi:heat shock protein HslJ